MTIVSVLAALVCLALLAISVVATLGGALFVAISHPAELVRIQTGTAFAGLGLIAFVAAAAGLLRILS